MTAKKTTPEYRKSGLVGSNKNLAVFYVEGKPYRLKEIQQKMDITDPQTLERLRRRLRETKSPYTWELIEQLAAHYKKMEQK
jgi:hypothetical protein